MKKAIMKCERCEKVSEYNIPIEMTDKQCFYCWQEGEWGQLTLIDFRVVPKGRGK